LMKLENKRKMMEQALASENFFCIPYAELTVFLKRTEETLIGERYSYILSHETKEGKKIITCFQKDQVAGGVPSTTTLPWLSMENPETITAAGWMKW